MRLTIKTKLMLFALGEYYKQVNEQLRDKSRQVVIPKTDFINVVKKTGITQKQPRAIYRNLEILEKKKFIAYKGRFLRLTPAGMRAVANIEATIAPYLNILELFKQKKVMEYTKKPQTVFVE